LITIVRPRWLGQSVPSAILLADQVGSTHSSDPTAKANAKSWEAQNGNIGGVESRYGYIRFAEPITTAGNHLLCIEDFAGSVEGSGYTTPNDLFNSYWIEDDDLDLSGLVHADFAGLSLTATEANSCAVSGWRTGGSGDPSVVFSAPIFGLYLHRYNSTPAYGLVTYSATSPGSSERSIIKTLVAPGANAASGIYLVRL